LPHWILRDCSRHFVCDLHGLRHGKVLDEHRRDYDRDMRELCGGQDIRCRRILLHELSCWNICRRYQLYRLHELCHRLLRGERGNHRLWNLLGRHLCRIDWVVGLYGLPYRDLPIKHGGDKLQQLRRGHVRSGYKRDDLRELPRWQIRNAHGRGVVGGDLWGLRRREVLLRWRHGLHELPSRHVRGFRRSLDLRQLRRRNLRRGDRCQHRLLELRYGNLSSNVWWFEL